MKRIQLALLMFCLTSLLSVAQASAQAWELTLRMSRDFGYGGFNNDIQGLFSLKAAGPSDLARVVFYIDSTAIGEVTQAPFNLQFNTDKFPLGEHELHAVGYSTSNQQYQSNVIVVVFVSSAEGTKAAMRFIVPVLGIVFGAILLAFIIPVLSMRGKKDLPLGAERKYNTGGGICPKCHRPFALPIISMNLGISKLARCPYCGKWSSVRIQSLTKLREAEQAELEWGKAEVKEESAEEKLQKNLDESKYQQE